MYTCLLSCNVISRERSPEDNLSGGLVVLLCEGGQHRLLKQNRLTWILPGPVRRAQRTVGRHHQAPVPTVGQQLHLGQVGVALHLHNTHR